MNQLNVKILYAGLNKPGRKGSISEIGRRCNVHRNTVRRILQGKPGRGLNAAAVIRMAIELLNEFEVADEQAAQAIEAKIQEHQNTIKRLRNQAAA
jgi:hypothetical protein